MAFLPTDYEAPKANGNYMRLVDGENKIRILTRPILGWEDWVDNKPVRYRYKAKPAKAHDSKKPLKHFWAVVVWNYNEEKIQIYNIPQATIRNGIEALTKDEDWGAPYFYDIKIVRKGEGMDVEYNVNPAPHKPLAAHIMQAFKENPCDLELYFDGGDPFSCESGKTTPGIFSQEDLKIVCDRLDLSQALTFESVYAECSPEYQTKVWDFWKKEYGIKDLKDFPLSKYEETMKGMLEHIKSLKDAVKEDLF